MMVFCLRYAFNGVNGVCGALQTATGRTDIGLKWTIYLIATTSIVYYLTSYFGITTFLCGIVALTFINALVCWYMQFKQMVGIKLAEYLTIYTRSFGICTVLSVIVYFVYSGSSIVYAIISGVVYVLLFSILILNSKDGNDILGVMKTMNVPYKVVLAIEKLKKV